MTQDHDPETAPRGSDRRKSEDRRKVQVDPAELPFPDRRQGDRRQMDRRVLSEEEQQLLVEKVLVPESKSPARKSRKKQSS